MKILKITILMIAVSALILISCSSPVSISGNGKKEDLKKMKHVAMLEFIIAPHFKPTFPLIDAAIFNSNLDDIAIEIMKANNEKVNDYESYFGEKYMEYSGHELLYGEDYYNSEIYERINKTFRTMSTDYDDEDFPEITIVKNSKNYFNFFGYDNPIYYFRSAGLKRIQPQLSEISSALQVDGLIIVVTGVSAESNMFSMERFSITKVIFYNDITRNFVIAESKSKPVPGKTASIDNYTTALDQYLIFSDFMLQVVFDLQENEWDVVENHHLQPIDTNRIKKHPHRIKKYR